ncbi:MAG TPA: hypothetical protein VMG12_18425, partial [Polyangiaceae bacterium]|nr:hypothetical protein [Polyangiaceae bacterium]
IGANGFTTLVDLVGSTATSFELSTIVGHGALSAAGDIVVGTRYVDGVAQLVRANVNTGDVEVLGIVGNSISRAYVTPDAATIVGFGGSLHPTEDNPLEQYGGGGFRWNAAGLSLGLPGMPAGASAWPEAVSSDGTVIAGQSPSSGQHFRWTEAGGYVDIAIASGQSATSLSADGSVLLGSLDPDDARDSTAFRWTEATGVVELTPGRTSLATDISADGNVIVATSWEEAQNDGAPPDDTFIWDAEHGTRTLDEVLAARGVDVSGWQFGHARSLSDDGKVLLGIGRCGGEQTLYRIVLSD